MYPGAVLTIVTKAKRYCLWYVVHSPDIVTRRMVDRFNNHGVNPTARHTRSCRPGILFMVIAVCVVDDQTVC